MYARTYVKQKIDKAVKIKVPATKYIKLFNLFEKVVRWRISTPTLLCNIRMYLRIYFWHVASL